MMNTKLFHSSGAILVAAMALTLFGAGCFGSTTKTVTGPDSGVWKTTDRGQTWVSKKALVDGPRITAGAAEIAVQAMALDKQDRGTIYLGTAAHGLVYSLDGGDSWTKMKALEATNVSSVAVDTQNKCKVYAASLNRIYRTKNCGRDWEAFFDPRTDKIFTQVVVDWFTPTVVYAGNNDGDIFKSTDEGVGWTVVKRANAAITSMIVSPEDSRVIYAGTDGDGIWKSLDSGVTWLQIRKEFGDIGDARRVVRVVPDPFSADKLIIVHRGGIAKSEDAGQTWKSLNLIGSVGENAVADLAIDANDSKKMVYTGPTALVFTDDGGATWVAKRLPSTSQGTTVLIDPKDGNTVYLGMQPPKKRK